MAICMGISMGAVIWELVWAHPGWFVSHFGKVHSPFWSIPISQFGKRHFLVWENPISSFGLCGLWVLQIHGDESGDSGCY